MTYEKIKEYYDKGLWTKEMVRNAVIKGRITPAQYVEIVGEEYAGSDS